MTRHTLALVLFCGGMAACGRAPDPPAASPPVADARDPAAPHDDDPNVVTIEAGVRRDLRVTTRQVESRPGGEQVTLQGELAVDERAYAEVGVPMAARVTRLLVNAGDAVRKGQPLAELTSPELGRARADHASATARVSMANAALARKRELAAERIVPLREVQEAESAAAEAQASRRAAQAALAAFGVAPTDVDVPNAAASSFTLHAPLGGTVIARAAVLGQMLDPATPAFRIGDLSSLWLTVHAFERDAVRIHAGAGARLVFPALPGQDFRGTVTMIGREVERASRTVPVRIDVRSGGDLLRPGMSAAASLPVGASDTPILTVPVAAVQRVRDAWCVFLPKAPGVFEIRRIGRGRDLAGEVEVLSGLAAADTIVVDGAFLLKAQAEKGEAGHDDH